MKKRAKKIVREMLKDLPERSKEIITRRYGLEKGTTAETLDSIGQTFGITRERVRQIETVAKKLIKKTEVYDSEAEKLAKELKMSLVDLGGVLKIDDFFEHISIAKGDQDHIYFIIDITDEIQLDGPTREFHQIMYTEKDKRKIVRKSIDSLYKKIGTEDILTEEEIVSKFLDKIEEEMGLEKGKKAFDETDLKPENLKRILNITKKISSNTLGGWGRVDSRNISAKGIKDMAYLSLREHKKPLYFKDIVSEIYNKFNKKVNPATCHNELIRDKRFILVGRGIYGLKEWGEFEGGTVSDVIEKMIKNNGGSLTRDEVVEKVLEKKHVKKQTVIINLGNKKRFKKGSDGKFSVIEKK